MQYKHKHTGQVVTKGVDGLYHSKEGGYTLQRWIFENSNDWEEVKEESNYLITAFRSTMDKSLARINALGLYYFGIPLKDFLHGDNSIEDGKWEIYSVKNSKGEEFTIGDVIKRNDKDFKLKSLSIYDNGCYVVGEDIFGEVNSSIELLNKPKSPIYTTTDGVDIKEGSCLVLYLVNKELNTLLQNVAVINNFSKQDAEVASRYLTFTSEENRERYIKENQKKTELDEHNKIIEREINKELNMKPIFVSADGKEMFEGDYYYVPQTDFNNNLKGTFLKFTVLNKKYSDNTARFSSRELAQEYIDNNKPKYSFVDILTAYNNTCSWAAFMDELKKLGK